MPTWKAEFQMAARTGNDLTIASFTMIDSQWMPMTIGDTKPFAANGALKWMEEQFRGCGSTEGCGPSRQRAAQPR